MPAINCVLENKVAVSFLAVILVYFLVMDATLYRHIQALPPRKPGDRKTYEPVFPSPNHSTSSTPPTLKLYSPFEKLSLKTIMLDPANQYIHVTLAVTFDRVTRLSSSIYFITPNFISACHFAIALVAAKFVSSEKLLSRKIGVLLFEFRTFLDALDGIVARARSHEVSDAPNFTSSGYYVDAVADTLATAALMVGIMYYLQRQSMSIGSYSLLPMWKSGGFDVPDTKTKSSNSPMVYYYQVLTANKKILAAAICLGFQLMISSIFWNRTITIYYDLLESARPTEVQGVLQNTVLKSVLMCGIFWFWRISNAHALLEYLLFSVFINKAWEFMAWIQYIGFGIFASLIFVTEMHYHYAKEYINSSVTPL